MAQGEGVRARGAAAGGSEQQVPNQLSVIIPTFNEVGNVRPLCERLFKATKAAGLDVELVVVDDESPGSAETEKITKDLATEGYSVRGHFRKKTEGRGLSSAVLLGFKMAIHPYVLCMDADLQHEPEAVPSVARPVLEGQAEFAVGSRYVAGGGVGFEWSILRRVVSLAATMIAWPVAPAYDPMSGFFCVSKDVLKRGDGRISPIGWKIGLEVMARCNCRPVVDVPITFQSREAGESKLTMKEYVNYGKQLGQLYVDKFGLLLLLPLLFLLLFVFFLFRVLFG